MFYFLFMTEETLQKDVKDPRLRRNKKAWSHIGKKSKSMILDWEEIKNREHKHRYFLKVITEIQLCDRFIQVMYNICSQWFFLYIVYPIICKIYISLLTFCMLLY